ncbi:DUF1028 domain-containing protein [Constantimarinum furrinae]|uniref:Secretion system C-terminal sorting domain-containing protein n=1 Tax=Constantimarinum furrinae TaxID=2562285 RepID=A0A7G8PVT6_9FLAO|nr:DUF1028 domain-containing protein [Constantimarinum furrinae]QNJ98452.1 hypothetical protein ALE3EI_1905 [Constantimarinum furrinae]
MKLFYSFVLTCVFTFSGAAQDTFSIIAVDPMTGEVGSAGASCVNGVGAAGIIDIITDIIPGRGGVNSQAYVCVPNINLQNAIARMDMGDSPSEVIDWLINNDACSSQGFNPEFRQYGVADFDMSGNPRTAGFTGSMADDYKEDRQGPTYSIQGNILLDQTVIDNMENNFNNTSGTLADKLMAAMQGANFPGADQRCLSAGTSSTTAYLLVFKADDDPNDPYLRLNVGQQPPGTEPITILQQLYDNFLTVPEHKISGKIKLFPNPVSDLLTLSVNDGLIIKNIEILDANGKILLNLSKMDKAETRFKIPVASLSNGIYFIKVKTSEGITTLKFVKR